MSIVRHSVLQDAEQSMDRIDAMKVFVAALDEGSLAGAGRKLGRSPAAVSRAVAFLPVSSLRPCAKRIATC
jgi:Bacterial regulatory helix-turn-helix protein, lysR family